ncbi:MAG: RNA-binding transcriptional accessory protein [Pseudomonadales bacterium]|nr:RNA-binding transcriptional accessory protein [Pseudomonadales bacterium]
MLPPIADRIATELGVRAIQVTATTTLLDEGATVPFIARYRKEVTGGLDDTQLRHLEERLTYLRELEERRVAILDTIQAQGKLTPALRTSIEDADTKQRLEDLYLPYKVKRRTKAQIAREAGLEALADQLLENPSLLPDSAAAAFLREPFTTEAGDNPGVPDVKAALDGAAAILMDRFAENANLLGELRQHQWDNALVVSRMVDGKADEGAKFRDYFDYSEPVAKVPPHRALALFRGRAEGVLRLALKLREEIDNDGWSATLGPCERRIAAHAGIRDEGRPADAWLTGVVRLTWRAKMALSIETTLFADLREAAESEAIRVFARNLRDLLLAAPAGNRTTMGLDPGIRTGVKVAVVDGTGKLLDTATIYPFPPKNDLTGSLTTLRALAAKHGVSLIAIGNGTASRETDALVSQLRKQYPDLAVHPVVVSEAGASVYSASELAAKEFPALDVSLRGAVSIARRLQDPLAELVKIDPKSIGVGQYQHDTNQTQLARALDVVVEDCVNSVGVDLNTASAPLLARISGLTPTLAENVVQFRDQRGAFRSRAELLGVPRLGPKTFEQAAGFLRVTGGDNPLDASAVHPEAYPVVQKILHDINKPVDAVMRNPDVLRSLDPARYTDDRFGLPTVQDIFAELEKPGRDPRPEFRTARFDESVTEIKDLKPDMVLEGVVTNVTNFGAFVDVGVHQDGLVHISALAEKFVKDPHEIVKAGDIVRVKVLEVDAARKRISLSMRLADKVESRSREPSGQREERNAGQRRGDRNTRPATAQKPAGIMAAAFANARKK